MGRNNSKIVSVACATRNPEAFAVRLFKDSKGRHIAEEVDAAPRGLAASNREAVHALRVEIARRLAMLDDLLADSEVVL